MRLSAAALLLLFLVAPGAALAAPAGALDARATCRVVTPPKQGFANASFAGGVGSPAAPRPALTSVRFDRARACVFEARLELPSRVPRQTAAASAQPPAPGVFQYSDAYYTRLEIDHAASYATLPLFAVEAYLGRRVADNSRPVTRAMTRAHRVVGYGLLGLFGANSVTGIWNLWEARTNPSHRGLRTAHGVLMLIADAGFAAAALTAPGHSPSDQLVYDVKKGEHMALASMSIGAATAGYLLMVLFR